MAAITDLSTASSVAVGDYLVVSQSGTDKKVTANKFAVVSLANTFTGVPQTVTSASNLAMELARTGAAQVALRFTDNVGSSDINGGGNGIYMSAARNVLLELNRSSGGYAALKLSDSGGNITLNGGGGGFLVSTLSGTGTVALEATSVGVVQRTTSDARLKTDVMRISSREALELVVALEPVRYNWIDQERRGAQREIGLVAQQVQPYVPEIISADDGGNLNLNYPRLTALLIGAIQELTARVAELEAAR